MNYYKSNINANEITIDENATLRDALDVVFGSVVKILGSGVCVVVDATTKKVVGVVTDGDFRRVLSHQYELSVPISEVMNPNPILINKSDSPKKGMANIKIALHDRSPDGKSKINHVIIINNDGSLYTVMKMHEFRALAASKLNGIAVYGMGYVGLTLAATFAASGFKLYGIEKDKKKCSRLQKGNIDIYEPGLEDLINQLNDNKLLNFQNSLNNSNNIDVHIVAVGTPVKEANKADLDSIELVSKEIGSKLRSGNMVVFRSTVPIGCTRNICIPLLEKYSGLRAGEEFSIIFAPERTVEGDALRELRELPQVIGALTENCLQNAERLFHHICPSIIQTPSLESAELVKLMNNTYRDLSFAFSNEMVLLCNEFNIDTKEIIQIANEGYPRSKIPFPSPGVGGYCLTKDPLLMSSVITDSQKYVPRLGLLGREINKDVERIPIEYIKRFAKDFKIKIEKLKVGVLGLAFKGNPETTDVRMSTSLNIIEHLRALGIRKIMGADYIVPKETLDSLKLIASSPSDLLISCDCVLILNNNHNHRQLPVGSLLSTRDKPMLLFDGWNQFSYKELAHLNNVIYSCLGNYNNII